MALQAAYNQSYFKRTIENGVGKLADSFQHLISINCAKARCDIIPMLHYVVPLYSLQIVLI